MKNVKHVGRIKGSGSKVIVVFRTLPGESDHALVLPVSAMTADQHDSIMKLLDTPQAQSAFEFGEMMFIRSFPDGRRMLTACQRDNMLTKMATTKIIMTPNTSDEIVLSDLNVLIAEQKNCAVDDLYTFVSGASGTKDATAEEIATVQDLEKPPVSETLPSNEAVNTGDHVLTDDELAKQFRSQADALYKEAARLRKEADELDPPAKRTTPAKTAASKPSTAKKPASKTAAAKKPAVKVDA